MGQMTAFYHIEPNLTWLTQTPATFMDKKPGICPVLNHASYLKKHQAALSLLNKIYAMGALSP